MFRHRILLILVLVIAIALVYILYEDTINKTQTLANISIGGKSYNVYLALTPEQWGQGFMNATSIGDCYGYGKCIGMIFIFPYASNWCFYMKNTIMPLKQYWISNNVISDVSTGTPYSTNVTCHYGNPVVEVSNSSNFSIGESFAINKFFS